MYSPDNYDIPDQTQEILGSILRKENFGNIGILNLYFIICCTMTSHVPRFFRSCSICPNSCIIIRRKKTYEIYLANFLF